MSKRKQIIGRGPPAPTLKAEHGQKYRDEASGHAYWMTDRGWEKSAVVSFEPTPEQKSAWVYAARQAGMSLEDWVLTTLDKSSHEPKWQAARRRPPSGKSEF